MVLLTCKPNKRVCPQPSGKAVNQSACKLTEYFASEADPRVHYRDCKRVKYTTISSIV